MKVYKFLANLCLDEESTLCFLCTRRLRPWQFDHWANALLFAWLRRQYTIGFTRKVTGAEAGECDDNCPPNCQGEAEMVLEATVCLDCGMWAHQHPAEGEMLAKARLDSIQRPQK